MQTRPTVPNLPPELAVHPQYEVLRELGKGGMGVVYLAKNKLMDRLEVLKVINKTLLDRPGAIERFLREIRSAAKLSHANVVGAYSALQLGDVLAFAMEYVEGEDLAAVVKAQGPLPVAHACYYIQQAALGLQHAFEKTMVHRDIKPHNLILAREGKKHVVKILDFGLAKVIREKTEDTGLTGEGQMLGTPDYISPEQTLDAASADIRADIYSLGGTLYYLLSGRPPFSAASLGAILLAHQTQEAPLLNLVRPEVPEELAAVVRKMMAKQPARRYQTPVEVARALAAFIKPGAQAGTTPKSSSDLSVGEPESKTERSAAPAVENVRREAATTQLPPAAGWETLSGDSSASAEPRKSGAVRKRRRPAAQPTVRKKWLIGGGVGVGVLVLALLGMWASGVFKVKTKDGTIVLENLPADAEVSVDGETVTLKSRDGKAVAIRVAAGKKHQLQVKKEGFKVFGEEVEIDAGDRLAIRVRLEPQFPIVPERRPVVERPKDPPPTAPAEEPKNPSPLASSRPQDKGKLTTTASGLKYEDLEEGTGVAAKQGDTVDVHYTGWLTNGKKFDSSLDRGQPFRFPLGAGKVIKGWEEGVSGMKVGSKRKLIVPPELGYGAPGAGGGAIPPNATLVFEIELLKIKELLPPKRDDRGFVSLFNGKDLTGWSVDGGPPGQWSVEGNTVVGQSKHFSTRNYLLTDKDYADFVFRFDFRVEDGSHGGVGIRAIEGEKMPLNNGLLFDHPLIKLTDPPRGEKEPTGTTHWLKSAAAYVRPLEVLPLPTGTWHSMEVVVRGDNCTATVGGKKLVNVTLDPDARNRGDFTPGLGRRKGKVGFQINTGIVRYRKIEIKELPPTKAEAPPAADPPGAAEGFVPLFNGKDLTGWKTHPRQPGNWRVEDGVLIGSSDEVSHLYTNRGDYINFHLRLEARINDRGNSGVYFRAPFGPNLPANVNMPVSPSNKLTWIAAYNAKIHAPRMGGLYGGNPGLHRTREPVLQPGEWLTYEIIVEGKHIVLKVNGQTTADYTDDQQRYKKGHIVLQQHGAATVAEFRKIEIKELTAK